MKQVEHMALGKLMYQINDSKDKGVILILTKEQCQEVINGYMGIKENYEKLEKAISILRNKKVDVDFLLDYDTLEDFNEGYNEQWQLTNEEYDLLKEVLE